MNSVQDPDVTNTGHQPYGFDTFQTLYNRYKVTRFEFVAELVQPPSTTNYSGNVIVAVGIQPPDATLTMTGENYFLNSEKPGVTTTAFLRAPESIGHQIVSGSYNIHDVVGITRQQFDADVEDYSALIANNPARVPQLKFAIAAGNAASGNPTTSCNLFFRLVYHVTFWDRIALSSS